MLIERRNLMAAKSGGTSNPYVTDGLLLHLDGIDSGGVFGVGRGSDPTKWIDLSGAGHVFDLANTATWSVDGLGLACDANGYGAYCQTALDRDDVLTVEVCCERITKNGTLVDLGGPNTNTIRMLGITSNYYPFIVAYSINTSQPGRFKSDSSNLSTGTFTAVRSDSSIYAPDSYYKDGEECDSTSGSAYAGSESAAPLSMSIGANVLGAEAMSGTFFSVRAYSRALTAAEVAANHAVDKARFGLPETT